MTQDTGKKRKNTKDQFYTAPAVAKECVDRILAAFPGSTDFLWIEPSAGNGAFLEALPAHIERRALDIDPKAASIETQDYLKWTPPPDRDILVFGNPPFGRQSSLAKAFIGKSCEFAKVVAFILPKSFVKPSMYGAFHRRFHQILNVELAKDSFVINEAKYDVPCVFQIWEWREDDRAVEERVVPAGFQYVSASAPYDLAIRRVGVYAGKCHRNDGIRAFSPQSHYFVKLEAACDATRVSEKVSGHVFPSNTVGPRSLSKSEVAAVLNAAISAAAISAASAAD